MTKNLQAMVERLKVHAPCHLLLDLLDLFIGKLDRPAATNANQVIMMPVPPFVLKAPTLARKINLRRQLRFFKQFNCAKNGGLPHPRVLLFHRTIQLIGANVPLEPEKFLDDQTALSGIIEPSLFQIFKKYLFSKFHDPLQLQLI